MDNKGKNIDLPIYRVVFIIVSFLLAILDMIMLQEKVQIVFGISNIFAMLVALIIATIANFMALTWGWGNGKRLERRALNRRSARDFSLWVLIGLSYAAFRIIPVLWPERFPGMESRDTSIVVEVMQIVILGISYIGSGLLIQDSAREIWDNDCVRARKARKRFQELRDDIAADSADIRESISILNNYGKNYKSLEAQKKKTENAIGKAEAATMADIVTKMKTIHPEISPSDCRKVMDEVLQSRKKWD